MLILFPSLLPLPDAAAVRNGRNDDDNPAGRALAWFIPAERYRLRAFGADYNSGHFTLPSGELL
jgi:hypothetical protein